MKKYELTNETITIDNGKTLYRIRALVDIEAFGVTIGDLGGYIEKEENLSHSGDAWVSDDARIYGDAVVYDNAWVYGDAVVCDNALVYNDAVIYLDAVVYGDAIVCGNALVYGNARIYGDAIVYGDAAVCGNAVVCGNARIYGDASICGDAELNKVTRMLMVGPIGSRTDTAIFFRTKENIIKVVCGCFYGTIDEFLAQLKLTHRNNKYGHAYRLAVELAKAQIELD